MIRTVKHAAFWVPVVLAGAMGMVMVGEAQAASVASIQRNYDQATGQVQPASAYDSAAAPLRLAPSDQASGACTQTFLSRRYNRC